MPETKLKKTQFIPFINTSSTSTASWARIAKSTIFDLAANPHSESVDYISTEVPVTEITGYEPSMEQELALYEGDPAYDFLFDMFYNLPTGSEAVVQVLMCFGGTDTLAWRNNATITLGSLNTVDGKLTFTINFGGEIERGTYAISDGAPTFTPASSSSGN